MANGRVARPSVALPRGRQGSPQGPQRRGMRAPCVCESRPGVRRRIWRGETRAWRPTMSPATPPADQQAQAQLGTELPRRAAAGPPAGPGTQHQGLGRVAAAWRAASWRKTTRSFSTIAAGLLVEQRSLLSMQRWGWSARPTSRLFCAREQPGGAAGRAGTQSGLAVDPERSVSLQTSGFDKHL